MRQTGRDYNSITKYPRDRLALRPVPRRWTKEQRDFVKAMREALRDKKGHMFSEWTKHAIEEFRRLFPGIQISHRPGEKA